MEIVAYRGFTEQALLPRQEHWAESDSPKGQMPQLWALVLFLALAFGCWSRAHAESVPTDKALHFGAGAIATGAAYVFYKEAFRMPEVPARLFSLAAGTFVNSVGEMMDEKPEVDDWLAGQLGVVSFVGATFIFDF